MAYAFVQAVKNSANSNVISVSPTAGNLLVLVSRTSSGGGSPTITSVVTNGAVSLTARVATFQNPNGRWISVYELANCPSGVTSLTVTYNGGTPGTCILGAIEYSGIATASPFIAGNSGNFQQSPGTSTDAITSGTATNVTSQPALIMGVVVKANGNSDDTAGTGYTNRFSGDNDFLVIDKRATSTGNYQVTATAATHGGTDEYTTFLLAYAEPGASGSTVIGAFPKLGPGVGPRGPAQFRASPRATLQNVVAALSGQSITSAQGTLTPGISLALTGNSVAGAAGTLAPALAISLSGIALTASQGTLTGITATQGFVRQPGPGLGPFNNLQLRASPRGYTQVVTSDVTVSLNGQAVTSTQGTLAPATSGSLSGQSASSAIGSLTEGVSIGLTGLAPSTAQGSLSAVTGQVVALSGLSVSSVTGSLIATVTVSGITTSRQRTVITNVRMSRR